MKTIILLAFFTLSGSHVAAQKPSKHLRNCDTTFVRGDTAICHKNYGKKNVLLKYVKDGELLFSRYFQKQKNGELLIETLKKGLLSKNHGEAVLLYSNGKVKARTWYKNGKLDGHNLTYYEDGKRQCVCNYKNGKQDGEQHVFYQNGQLYLNTVWEEGRLLEVRSLFDEQGKPLEIGTFKNGNGDLFEYDNSGRKVGIRTFKNGSPGKKKRLN